MAPCIILVSFLVTIRFGPTRPTERDVSKEEKKRMSKNCSGNLEISKIEIDIVAWYKVLHDKYMLWSIWGWGRGGRKVVGERERERDRFIHS